MTWYSAGTITLTNGSTQVIAVGARFVANVSIGDALIPNGGNPMQIANVVSDTELTLARPWLGATAGGVTYDVQPTQSYERDLALAAAAILNTFAAVRDGVGQGLFGDGSAAAPGFRFIFDQDTGLRRASDNTLAIVTGGVDRIFASPAGVVSVGRLSSMQADTVGVAAPTLGSLPPSAGFLSIQQSYGILTGLNGNNGSTWMQVQRVDGSAVAYDLLLQPSGGNVLIGTTSGRFRLSVRGTDGLAVQDADGNLSFQIAYGFSGATAGGESSAPSIAFLRKYAATGRSINAAGTVNATGADYAEYMLKADGCGAIAKGDVCGVDRDGKLTKTWADAISFVIKSTDPSLVGGDTWAAHLPPRPEAPGDQPIEPTTPAYPADPGDQAAVASYEAAVQAYPALVAAYKTDLAAWQAAVAQHDVNLPAWEDDLETARRCVDRIAFCGQVPCNVTGDFEVGDYIVAAANGGGIKAIAIKLDDMSLAQYARRIGKVWAIRDGRAWIDVQHG